MSTSVDEINVGHPSQHAETISTDRFGDCAICISLLTAGQSCKRIPSCRHMFHAECVGMWLQSHPTCPLCRAQAIPAQLYTAEKWFEIHLCRAQAILAQHYTAETWFEIHPCRAQAIPAQHYTAETWFEIHSYRSQAIPAQPYTAEKWVEIHLWLPRSGCNCLKENHLHNHIGTCRRWANQSSHHC